jgi:hypothetical protein
MIANVGDKWQSGVWFCSELLAGPTAAALRFLSQYPTILKSYRRSSTLMQ